MHSLNQLKELKSFYPRIIKDHRWGRAIEYDGYDLDIMEILLEQKKEIDKLKKQVKMLVENDAVIEYL